MPIRIIKQNYSRAVRTLNLPEAVLDPEQERGLIRGTPQAKKFAQAAITQLGKDRQRACYLNEEGPISSMKSNWLRVVGNEEANDEVVENYEEVNLALAAGVYPAFAQGQMSSSTVGELLFDFSVFYPYMNEINAIAADDPDMDAGEKMRVLQENRKKTCFDFSYKTQDGTLAGLCFQLADNNDKAWDRRGFIISIAKNTTASPDERELVVLASTNCVERHLGAMDEKYEEVGEEVRIVNDSAILEELRSAIGNEKVYELVSGIFDRKGSPKLEAAADLNSRFVGNHNLDDRDRKNAQLDILFAWAIANGNNDARLNAYILGIKGRIQEDINFFKKSVFEPKLDEVIDKIASSLHNFKSQRDLPVISKQDLKKILKELSKNYANAEFLVEEKYLKKNHAFYKAAADRFKEKALALSFDGTREDKNRISKMIGLGSGTLFQTLNQPKEKGFLRRNLREIGYSLFFGVLTGIAVGLALTGILAPVSVLIYAVGSAVLASLLNIVPSVYMDEKIHNQKLMSDNQKNSVLESAKDPIESLESVLEVAKYAVEVHQGVVNGEQWHPELLQEVIISVAHEVDNLSRVALEEAEKKHQLFNTADSAASFSKVKGLTQTARIMVHQAADIIGVDDLYHVRVANAQVDEAAAVDEEVYHHQAMFRPSPPLSEAHERKGEPVLAFN